MTVSSTLPCMLSVKPFLEGFVVPFENQVPLSFEHQCLKPYHIYPLVNTTEKDKILANLRRKCQPENGL